ncbi:pantoate--beta-alanine ligase [Bacillus circulans]|uniref:pantoate--beta-alanine ligase n=1 Tax=Niallia circulans TaxID=1397 RepID=UPI0013D5AE6D|nr:pantoate--beta-alanine ligase [Niallia circulans]NRG27762.1 pantoate--beta-alanine ligase [Niallia circulans]QJX62734.1 pantoate--beta-alanine ligase [Niallia circulans]UQZ77106.1 pantoate--beta-alanine ligase [Niallia circulans]
MNIVTNPKQLQDITTSLQKNKVTIGFVPTMGYLHEGHRALLKAAREQNEIVIMSVFVNPLQFGPNEDLASYPKDFEHDKQVAMEEGVDYLFHPSVEEMYPGQMSVTVKVERRTNCLCGKSRPGHFDGVATVLTKLFHLVQPTNVYFGKKDAQQVAVVDGLIEDFHFPINLVAVNTVREEDGLAKSSRNVRLTPIERREAGILYKSLSIARSELIKGTADIEALKKSIITFVEKESSGKVDYFEILSYPQLETLKELNGKMVIAIAVHFSKARLIDNIIFELDHASR